MANDLANLFETHILPGVAGLQAPTMFRNSMLSKIYMPGRAVVGQFAHTINVNIPIVNEGDVIDIGAGPIQITDAEHDTVPLTVNRNPSLSRRIADFDATRTPYDFAQTYLMVAIESVTRKIDRYVCNLVTSTNFNVHTSITGGADIFTRANVSLAWANLESVGVPDVMGDRFFVTHSVPYSNMIADSTWINEAVVGVDAATNAQQRAMLAPAYGMSIDRDQLMPLPAAGTYAALAFHRYAITLVPVVPADGGSKPHVRETYYTVPGTGLTFRIQWWYDPREQGWILHVHAMFALAVTRPNYGQFLVTT